MKLFIVPTPIGNLEDITLRALNVLRSVDLILCEDTRTTRKLLQHYEIDKRCMAYHIFNEHEQMNRFLGEIKTHEQVALVSDAGTPGISDPGFLLARTCAEEGIEVQTLPGATACIPAIVSSGLPCDRFAFEGFLPQKKGRQTFLTALEGETRTMVFYESPYRLVKTLEQMIEHFGPERRCSVAREISKLHEEHKRGTLQEVAAWFREHEPKGEIVLVVAGAEPVKPVKQKRYGRGEETEDTEETE